MPIGRISVAEPQVWAGELDEVRVSARGAEPDEAPEAQCGAEPDAVVAGRCGAAAAEEAVACNNAPVPCRLLADGKSRRGTPQAESLQVL